MVRVKKQVKTEIKIGIIRSLKVDDSSQRKITIEVILKINKQVEGDGKIKMVIYSKIKENSVSSRNLKNKIINYDSKPLLNKYSIN